MSRPVSHRKLVERARKKWDKASRAFTDWAIASGFGHVRSSEMDKALADCPEGIALLAADRTARKALIEAEDAAVHALKAWRGTFGLLSWY